MDEGLCTFTFGPLSTFAVTILDDESSTVIVKTAGNAVSGVITRINEEPWAKSVGSDLLDQLVRLDLKSITLRVCPAISQAKDNPRRHIVYLQTKDEGPLGIRVVPASVNRRGGYCDGLVVVDTKHPCLLHLADIIVAVNGVVLLDLNWQSAQEVIAQSTGTTRRLTVLRDNELWTAFNTDSQRIQNRNRCSDQENGEETNDWPQLKRRFLDKHQEKKMFINGSSLAVDRFHSNPPILNAIASLALSANSMGGDIIIDDDHKPCKCNDGYNQASKAIRTRQYVRSRSDY